MATPIESNTHTPTRRSFFGVLLLVLMVGALVAGVWQAISYSLQNRWLAAEIQQLESELGVLDVVDPDRVYFTAIQKQDVPATIAKHVDRVWQYRCHLPANYDFKRFAGDGVVCADGFFVNGSHGSGWSTPNQAATNERLTISVTKKQDHFALLACVGDYQDTGILRLRDPSNAKLENFVVEPVLASGQKSCSFGRDEIIPIFRIYDPTSAKEKVVAGKKQLTYSGALMVFCPTSQEPVFQSLRSGELPGKTQVSEGPNL